MKHWTHSLAIVVGFALAATAGAHHSAVMFDTSQEISVEGVISRYEWRNPHVYMAVDTAGPNGETFVQQIEAGAPSVLNPLGLTPDSLTPGERVTVYGNPNKSGAGRIMLGRYLTREDGSQLPLNIAAPSIRSPQNAQATSLAGTWFSPLSALRGFVRARGTWNVTERGRLARDEWDITQAAYADCIPVTAPTLMVYSVTATVEVNADTVVFDVDWMTSRRVVYTDGRAHPENGEPSLQGHSIGHWEGETLVVDTAQYAEHTEGITIGFPSGLGKHTVERFSLADDGRHMDYEVMLEDPEYLAEPLSYSAQLEYRPDLEPTGLACDLETAQRYLTDE